MSRPAVKNACVIITRRVSEGLRKTLVTWSLAYASGYDYPSGAKSKRVINGIFVNTLRSGVCARIFIAIAAVPSHRSVLLMIGR